METVDIGRDNGAGEGGEGGKERRFLIYLHSSGSASRTNAAALKANQDSEHSQSSLAKRARIALDSHEAFGTTGPASEDVDLANLTNVGQHETNQFLNSIPSVPFSLFLSGLPDFTLRIICSKLAALFLRIDLKPSSNYISKTSKKVVSGVPIHVDENGDREISLQQMKYLRLRLVVDWPARKPRNVQQPQPHHQLSNPCWHLL